MSGKSAILVATLAFATAMANAETPNRQWTLDQCIDYALNHNIQLRQKRIAVDQSDINLEQSKAQLFPSLSFATNQNVSWRPWSKQYVGLENGTMTTTSSEVNYNGTYGLNAQWTVWNGGKNRKNIERSRLSLQQSVTDAEMTEADLEEQIVQCYVQILYQAEAVNVNRQILESTELQLRRAKEMYELGTMSRADLAQMEAQMSQDEYNVTNSETQLDNFKLSLKRILQIVDAEQFDVAVPSIPDESVMSLLPAQNAVYEAALATRPEIRYNKSAIEIADLDIDIAKRGYLPTVSVSGAINTSNTSGMRSVADQWKTNLSNSIGLTLSVPILDQKQNKTNTARARLDRENAILSLESEKTQLYSDIEQYWLNAHNSQQQFRSAQANVAAMQESYNLISEQYNVGLKDIVDLITGKNNLLQAEQQLLQSKYTALLNIALLRYYAGEKMEL